MKIDGLVVCVDYWQELSISFDRWVAALDTIVVVTSASDMDTRLGSSRKAKVFPTAEFYAGGAKFNKAAAMQAAIEYHHPWRDWVLLFDADIIPPVDLREQLEAADLEPGYLYGAKRHQANPKYWDGDPLEFPILNDREIPGYFHLFHVTDPAVADRADVLPTQFYHAGNYDSEFQNRWGKGSAMDRKRWLDFHVLHIGEPGRHWCGRGNDDAMRELHAARAAGRSWKSETIEGNPMETKPPKKRPAMLAAKKKRKRNYTPTGRKPGRPKGSRNKPKPPVVDVVATRCINPQCRSTRRAPYAPHPQTQDVHGIALDGSPYTRVVWRRTKCLDCGQCRVDKTYENEADPLDKK